MFIPLEEKNQSTITKKVQMVEDLKSNGSGIKPVTENVLISEQ